MLTVLTIHDYNGASKQQHNTFKELEMSNELKLQECPVDTTQIDETFLREYMMECDKEQIIEILISTLKNEERLRNELDKVSGIIR